LKKATAVVELQVIPLENSEERLLPLWTALFDRHQGLLWKEDGVYCGGAGAVSRLLRFE
jgi:hypothetical protein